MKYAEMKKEIEKTKGGINLTPSYMEWKKEGDNVTGRLMSISQVKSSLSEGFYNQYVFETDNGLVKFRLGGATDNETGKLMHVAGIYIIEFLGKEKIKGGKSLNRFKVIEIDEGSLPVASIK